MPLNAGKRKLSCAARIKHDKEKQTAEDELLKKIPKVSCYFSAQPQSSNSSFRKSSTVVSLELQDDEVQEAVSDEDTESEKEDNYSAQLTQMIQQKGATTGQNILMNNHT
jgi:uncharacterized FlgJ-related protein